MVTVVAKSTMKISTENVSSDHESVHDDDFRFEHWSYVSFSFDPPPCCTRQTPDRRPAAVRGPQNVSMVVQPVPSRPSRLEHRGAGG